MRGVNVTQLVYRALPDSSPGATSLQVWSALQGRFTKDDVASRLVNLHGQNKVKREGRTKPYRYIKQPGVTFQGYQDVLPASTAPPEFRQHLHCWPFSPTQSPHGVSP